MLLKVVHISSSIVVELFAQVIRSRRSIVQGTALYKANPPESFSDLIVLRTLLELLIQGCASVLGPQNRVKEVPFHLALATETQWHVGLLVELSVERVVGKVFASLIHMRLGWPLAHRRLDVAQGKLVLL